MKLINYKIDSGGIISSFYNQGNSSSQGTVINWDFLYLKTLL